MAFYTSFEPDDPKPTWTDTADIDGSGAPRADGATLRTQVGSGPARAYTAKTGVGFTGRYALRYQGFHRETGPAHVVNRIFWVEVPVTANTVLSYRIFPELGDGAHAYAATFAAVDLAFDDGTLASELGATDQLGFELSALAQGRSKALYPDQWNHRAAWIGEVAAGRTIRRVLLRYDNPHGPAEFAGWVDDIAIEDQPAVSERRPVRPVDFVCTTRGTNSSHEFSRGNTIPATAMPNGFNFWIPVTDAGALDRPYVYQQHNDEDNSPRLQAFSVSHQPSPWLGDRHTFQVMPSAVTGRPTAHRRRRALPFRHDNETARAHQYRVRFDNGLVAELAPTEHAAMFRFTFPGQEAHLVFDNVSGEAGLAIDAATGTVTGHSDVRSGLSVGAGTMYVYGRVDRPVTSSGRLRGGLLRGLFGTVSGFLTLAPPERGERNVVTLRIATSLISLEQARRNLELEIAEDDDFDMVRRRAEDAWQAVLRRVEVAGASEDQLTTLYSNLYRLFLYPNIAHENTGSAQEPEFAYASPFSGQVEQGRLSVNHGFWDTYRTCWPAYALLAPSRCGELIDGFLQHYRDGGWISRWSAPGPVNLMTGTNSDVAFADAYRKGVRNFDVVTAYRAALRNATALPPTDSVGRKGLARANFVGYVDAATSEGLSWTLEGCVNDFGIAGLADALGDGDNHEYFADRARNYVHSFDRAAGFFQGRLAGGRFRHAPTDYDPRVWGYDCPETNGWTTLFCVPHDARGLVNLLGGHEALAARLDEYFDTPETARFPGSYGHTIHEMLEARDLRMGQYGHSNQPAHHIAYLYVYAGQPWKAQEKVREVLARAYAGSEIGQGYCGDEDNGEMSAWWLFSALGFYPVAVGSPYYVIGSPLFTTATVHLEGGNDLVVNAPDNSARNIYVQGLRVNGERHDRAWLPHEALAAGAVLDFDMGPRPSAWATGPEALPPSLTTGETPPVTRWDVTAPGYATALASDGRDPSRLFDDTCLTQRTFEQATPWVCCTLPEAQWVVQYTLTSGRWTGDPTSWRLEGGSGEAGEWVLLDERAGVEFPWRRQTRAFSVATPGHHRSYRLTITGSTEEWTTLTQLELLAE